MTKAQQQIERLRACVDVLREIVAPLDSTLLIMADKECRDHVNYLVAKARAALAKLGEVNHG